MTEAASVNERAVPFQAALMFNASPGLNEVLRSSLSERGLRTVGRQALRLAGSPLAFASEEALDDFEDDAVGPLMRTHMLERIPLLDHVKMTPTYSNGEAVRLIFSPPEATRIALAGLHGKMLERLRFDNSSLYRIVRQRSDQTYAGNLTMTVPRYFLDIGDLAAQQTALGVRMEAERTRRSVPFVQHAGMRRHPLQR